MVLDATSQPDGGRVSIDGSAAGSDAVGLHLTDGTSTVEGFVLNAFKTAIQADGGSGHRIVSNRIGTDLAATAVGVPGEVGIRASAPHTHIGGTAAQANVVVASSAIVTTGADTEVRGNLVAVGADGSTPLADSTLGGIVTGGPGTVISDNTVRAETVGIGALGAGASGARITNNHVGTTRDGTATLSMAGYGVRVDGAPGALVSGNVIDTGSAADVSVSGSKQYTTDADSQIHLTAPSSDAGGTVTGGNATVRGNIIGLLGDATTAGPGGSEGVWGWAGAAHLTIDANTIAGQTGTAVELDGGSGHVVTGNRLGVDRAGTTTYPVQEGIHLVGTNGAKIGGIGTAGNVIGGAHDAGILLSGPTRSSSTTIAGNSIGIGRDGAALANDSGIKIRAADHTTIGPDNVVGRNQTGIDVGAGSTTASITGNRIGTRGTAATGAPNITGIRIGDGSSPRPDATTVGPGNVISLNRTGIVSTGTRTRVNGNRIGTAASTDDPVPNGAAGLQVLSGDLTATGNTIAYDNPGVDVASTARVGLHANRMFGNDTAAIRHPGAPAAPDLLAAIRTTRGTTTRTLLVMTGLPQGDAGTVEVFANSSCDEPQARFVLALTKVKAAAAKSLVVNMVGRANRSFLTVDYTDAAGNTSQLSGCRPAGPAPDSDGDGSPDVLEQLFGFPGSSTDPSLGVVYTDTDQILLMKTTAGRFTGLGAADDPSPLNHPAGLQLPYGLINFELRDLPADGRATVLISGGPGVALLAHDWAKYGRIPSGATTWYDFGYDTFTGTGAQTVSQGTPDEALSLTFVDGARGDDDGQRNGVIRDPGGPATFAPASRRNRRPRSRIHERQRSLAETGTNLAATLRVALVLLALGLMLTVAAGFTRERLRSESAILTRARVR